MQVNIGQLKNTTRKDSGCISKVSIYPKANEMI